MDDCPLRKVRDIQVLENNGYWVDEDNAVLLKKMGKTAAPEGCPVLLLEETEYENIFLTTDKGAFLPLGSEMKLTTWIASRDDYILYEAEQKMNNLKLSSAVLVCA